MKLGLIAISMAAGAAIAYCVMKIVEARDMAALIEAMKQTAADAEEARYIEAVVSEAASA